MSSHKTCLLPTLLCYAPLKVDKILQCTGATLSTTPRLDSTLIVNTEHSEHGEQHTVRLMYVTLVLIVLLRRNSMVTEYTVFYVAEPENLQE